MYMDKARAERQAAGRPIPDEILAGLSPLIFEPSHEPEETRPYGYSTSASPPTVARQTRLRTSRGGAQGLSTHHRVLR
jgi:hypothetical protein